MLSLQQHIINISRAAAVPQVQVEAEHAEVQLVESEAKQQDVVVSPEPPGDQPRILYQCGDCEELFKSLDLWQHHRKEGACQQPVAQGGSEADAQPEPEAYEASAETTSSTLHPEDSSQCESQSNEAAAAEADYVEEDAPQAADSASEQAADPPASEEAAPNSPSDDSSSRRRASIKKPKPDPVLLCVDCGSCFGLVSELVAHRKTQHGFEEALHRCSVCGESFLNTTLFLYHRKQHKQKGEERVVLLGVPAVCVQSQEEAPEPDPSSSSSPPSPSSTATPAFSQPELFLCTQCGQSFSKEAGLVAHRAKEHGLKEPLHRCAFCNKSFMNTTQFLYHRREHRASCWSKVVVGTKDGDEAPDAAAQDGKRLLSPSNESGPPTAKRRRPSFKILSSLNPARGTELKNEREMKNEMK